MIYTKNLPTFDFEFSRLNLRQKYSIVSVLAVFIFFCDIAAGQTISLCMYYMLPFLLCTWFLDRQFTYLVIVLVALADVFAHSEIFQDNYQFYFISNLAQEIFALSLVEIGVNKLRQKYIGIAEYAAYLKLELEKNSQQGNETPSVRQVFLEDVKDKSKIEFVEKKKQLDQSIVQGDSIELLEILGNEPSPQEMSAVLDMLNGGKYTEAAALAQTMTERFPLHSFGWNILGFVFIKMERNDDALAALHQAVTLSPDDSNVYINLGIVLTNMSRLSEAEASYNKALSIRPDFAEVHLLLGNTLQQLGRLNEAEASYRRVLEIKPEFAEAHFKLGEILKSKGRITEAELSLRRAVEIKPDYFDAINALGVTLTLLGRFSEAEACHKQALELRPDDVDALVCMGFCASDEGRFAEAEAYFWSALAIKPNMALAMSAIAGLRKMTRDDAPWLAAAEELVQRGIEPIEESDLRFAMGKYFDDVKDFDRAFFNYRRANELSKTFTEKYDRQMQAIFFDSLIRTYDRERLLNVQKGASASALPVFILGMPRSGTSLVEQIIASHPAVFGAGELHFWHDAMATSLRQGSLGEARIREFADEYLRLVSGFSVDAMRVVDKMPGNFINIGLIHTVFPNARIIHIRRNPIDTCLSIYFTNFEIAHCYANDLADLAHFYQEYHRLMAHWRAMLPSGVLLDVPYEGIVEDKEYWARKIVEFIGMDWDGYCLDFHKTERRVTTASQWQVRQKMYMTSIERWRNYEKFIEPLKGLIDLS